MLIGRIGRKSLIAGSVSLLATVCAAAPATARTHAAAIAHGPGRAAFTLPTNVRRACPWPPPPGHASCMALRRTDVKISAVTVHGRKKLEPAGGAWPRVTVDGASVALPPYGAADLQNAYNLTPYSSSRGSGQTVAIVDAGDDPNAESDLNTYRANQELPPCTSASGCFRKVNEQGQARPLPPPMPNGPGGDWVFEESLDLDMVSAICPNCNILLVEAASDSTSDLQQAAEWAGSCTPEPACIPPASYVSMSFGGPDNEYTFNFEEPGVVYTASTGDNGYGVEYPAGDYGTVAVGGTSLLPAANTRGWDEIAWSGAGSGCSDTSKPPWQSDTGCRFKTVADVSAVADATTGVTVYDSYPGPNEDGSGFQEAGGTSASSPIIASVFALAGPPTSQSATPAKFLYAQAAPGTGEFNDIVAGTNSFSGCDPAYLCTAEPGYDGPSGVGTPNGITAFFG